MIGDTGFVIGRTDYEGNGKTGVNRVSAEAIRC